MTAQTEKSNIKTAVFYFLLSTIITAWFIEVSPVYDNMLQKILSCSIAGAKWSIQIVVAYLLLQDKKWIFIRNIGFTCFLGSLILVPYSLFGTFGMFNKSNYFLLSLVLSVTTMIVSYWFSVRKAGVDRIWWAGWMICLAIAITGQLKLVFNISLL